MAQVYRFTDENGQVRLFAEIDPDPAGTPFDGGVVTNDTQFLGTVTIGDPLSTQGGAVFTEDGEALFLYTKDGYSGQIFSLGSYDGSIGITATSAGDVRLHGTTLGLFDQSPAARQTLHSGTATPEQIALALEASTLMTGD